MHICKCKENGVTDCKYGLYFSKPDCNIGWDSSHDFHYHGYDLYMLVDSQSYLPVFPHFCHASSHDSHGFMHAFFRMKSFLPGYTVSEVLLDSAHNTMPYYQYFKRKNITPFININGKGGRPPCLKNDFCCVHYYVQEQYLLVKVQCQSFAGIITQDSERLYFYKIPIHQLIFLITKRYTPIY